MYIYIYIMYTLPENNSQFAPENGPKRSVFPTTQFQGRTVSFREGTNTYRTQIGPLVLNGSLALVLGGVDLQKWRSVEF